MTWVIRIVVIAALFCCCCCFFVWGTWCVCRYQKESSTEPQIPKSSWVPDWQFIMVLKTQQKQSCSLCWHSSPLSTFHIRTRTWVWKITFSTNNLFEVSSNDNEELTRNSSNTIQCESHGTSRLKTFKTIYVLRDKENLLVVTWMINTKHTHWYSTDKRHPPLPTLPLPPSPPPPPPHTHACMHAYMPVYRCEDLSTP